MTLARSSRLLGISALLMVATSSAWGATPPNAAMKRSRTTRAARLPAGQAERVELFKRLYGLVKGASPAHRYLNGRLFWAAVENASPAQISTINARLGKMTDSEIEVNIPNRSLLPDVATQLQLFRRGSLNEPPIGELDVANPDVLAMREQFNAKYRHEIRLTGEDLGAPPLTPEMQQVHARLLAIFDRPSATIPEETKPAISRVLASALRQAGTRQLRALQRISEDPASHAVAAFDLGPSLFVLFTGEYEVRIR